jgi:serine/threonine-protein kinase
LSAARYKITRKIADGGMAELYLGVQRGAAGFERKIVIKRVRAAYVADPATRETLVDEAHVAMSLNHSNIVQVLDLGFAAGRYFLVLELVDGWDLSVLLDRAKHADLPMPAELSLHVAAEVCRALAFAHGKTKDGAPLGIVHRDLNPHNVLISEQGEVKLTDFGIATAKTMRRAKTLVGVVKGKLGFMSPEQARGEEVLDSRSDLFSMGCTLYQMVAGVQPFAGGTELEMLLRMEQCAFKPIEEAKPDLAPELKTIIQKAMQKRPADRFASAEQMLADLERVQRASFKPAGQSELKAWLTELTRRDQVPTIGRRETAASAAAHGELEPGATLVLEEIESDPGAAHRAHGLDSTPPLKTAPPAARLPEAPPVQPAPPAGEAPLPAKRRTPPPPAPQQAAPAPSAAQRPADRKSTLDLTPAVKALVASEATTDPPGPSPVPVEEAPALPRWFMAGGIFVGVTVAAMALTVFLARGAFPVDATAPDAALDLEPAAKESEVAYPSLEDAIVPCDSAPAGASVAVNGQPAGTTPLDLRLRPGKAHEVRFELSGHRVQVRKVFVVPGKKPPRVSATLEKLKWYLPQ